MTRPALLLALSVLLVLLHAPGHCGTTPAQWPWRGVAVAFDGAQPADVPMLVDFLRINSISLQIKPRLRASKERIPPREALRKEFQWAADMLDACRAAHIVGILVFYDFPIDPALGFNQKDHRFWDDPALVGEMVDLAGELAAFCQGRGPELAGYQIQSEPAVRGKGEPRLPQDWPGITERVIRSIRAADPARWIVVSLTLGANPAEYAAAKPLKHERIVYNAHMYLPHQFTHQGLEGYPLGPRYPGRVGLKFWDRNALRDVLQPLAAFGRKHGVPVWIGEFSAARWATGAEQYLTDLVDIFNAEGWGWCYFAYGGVGHAWNPDYDTNFAVAKDAASWKPQFQGAQSVRWRTLYKMFRILTAPAS